LASCGGSVTNDVRLQQQQQHISIDLMRHGRGHPVIKMPADLALATTNQLSQISIKKTCIEPRVQMTPEAVAKQKHRFAPTRHQREEPQPQPGDDDDADHPMMVAAA
jgi:hypothetical protein